MTFICLLFLFLLAGCKDSTSNNYDETRINEIMYNIKSAYNDNDIDALMQYFHTDYLHNGQSRWEIKEVWLNRKAEFPIIDFQNTELSIHDDIAVVSFRMKLSKSTEDVYSDEPADHGDLSYFIYDNSDWKVYGNQHQ